MFKNSFNFWVRETHVTQPVIPLTGSDVAGPLGVSHLPRLWQRAILSKTGLLTDRRYTDTRGFDVVLTAGLGVDLRALHAFLSSLPTYMDCEKWIRANAQRLDDVAIARINEKVQATHDNLPIWDEFHAWLVANKGKPHDPIVPAISSRSSGPLGLNHLARLWVKLLLDGVDLLPVGYRAGRIRVESDEHGWRKRVIATGGLGGLDVPFLDEFGLDVDQCVSYVKANLPSYLTFETYFRTNAKKFGPNRVAPFNALRIKARPEKAAQERADAGLDDPEMLWSFMLNDLMDWKDLHDLALSTGVRPAPTPQSGRRASG
jgi:hypothetical protein